MSGSSLASKFFDRNIGNPFSLSLSWLNMMVGGISFRTIMNFPLPVPLEKGGHFQFLTNLSLLLTLIYFTLNIFIHLFEIKKLEGLRAYVNAITLSVEFVVTTVYWSLRLTVKELILAGPGIPLDLDLAVHLMPFASLCIEYFCFMHAWPVTYSHAFGLVYFLTASYWFFLEHLLSGEGEFSYPYPFLNVDTPKRVVIFVFVGFVAYLSFVANKFLHSLLVRKTQVKINKDE